MQKLTLLAVSSRQSVLQYNPEQLVTFSPQIFDHFANGRLSLRKGLPQTSTSVRTPVSVEEPILITSRLDTSWRLRNLFLRSK